MTTKMKLYPSLIGILPGILLGATALSAQAQVPTQSGPVSTNIAKCLTSGTADQHLKACYSDHGNLVGFETPAGQRHIVKEGYILCYASGVAWDSGEAEQGWGPATISPNKATITRKTTDGALQLTQTFSRDAVQKTVSIKMDVKNLTKRPIYVTGFARRFDGAVDNRVTSVWDRTPDSVSARSDNAISLTAVTDFPQTAVTYAPKVPWDSCFPRGFNELPVSTELGSGHVFIPMGFNLGPNKIESATFVYRRY